jgi:hypothetical protein
MTAIFRVLRYVLTKLAASGTAWLSFQLMVLAFSSGDLYRGYQLLQNTRLAFLFFVYGTACSLFIDALLHLIRRDEGKRVARWLLFTMSGFLYFVITIGWNAGTVLAGLIGALFALVQSAASLGFARSRKVLYPAAAAIALVLLTSRSFDYHGIKKDWNTTRTPTSYEASFAYFNGEASVPMSLNSGDPVRLRIEWSVREGGYGSEVRAPDGKPVPMQELPDGSYAFRASRDGVYEIRVTGTAARGHVKVAWKSNVDKAG